MKVLAATALFGILAFIPVAHGVTGFTGSYTTADYFVLFSNTATGTDTARCAGILVHPDVVVTTAQCANSGLKFVRVGYKSDSSSIGVTSVVNIYNNPGWSPNSKGKDNDIAAVVIKDQFDKVKVPVLATLNDIPYNINDRGGSFTVIGAGKDVTGAKQSEVKRAVVQTQDFIQCFNSYRSSSPSIPLSEGSQFCAGVTNVARGPCPDGDIGSPLITPGGGPSGRDLVFGLASLGGCAKADKSFVYTRISSFTGFIDSTICARSATKPKSCPTPAPAPKPTPAPTRAPTDSNSFFFSVISDTVEGPGSFRCGGVLIHEDIILTSAECVKSKNFKKDDFVVRVGYTNDFLSVAVSGISMATPMDVSTQKKENLPNDIAVIKLETAISDVAIPILNTNSAVPPDNGAIVYYAQAGSKTDGGGVVMGSPKFTGGFSDGLMTGISSTSLFKSCRKSWDDLPGYASLLQESLQFCVASSAGPCNTGASGSPLWMKNSNGGNTLVGVASQGSCGTDTLPFVWSRVSAYTVWINEKICSMSANPPKSCKK